MTDFFQIICYNITNTPSMIETIETWISIVGGIITGVVAIVGLFCFKPLKDKARAATFTFWSQIRIRLEMIHKWLAIDYSILDNLYSPNAKIGTTVLAPDQDRIDQLKSIVTDTLSYIKTAEDQMPAYRGWSVDYARVVEYLEEMLVYDISDNTKYFKFTNPATDAQRKAYCQEICKAIEKICSEIKKKQDYAERRIV